MAFSLLGTATADNPTLTTAVGVNDVIVIPWGLFDTPTVAFSDNLGNTYTQVVAVPLTGDGDTSAYFRCQVTTAGTPTIVATTTSAENRAWCAQASTGYAASAFDIASAGGHGTSTTPSDTTGSATTQADEVVFVLAANTLGGTVTYTAGSGFTLDTQFQSGDQMACAIAHKIVAATGTQTGGFTMSASKEWSAVVVTFKLNTTASTAGSLVYNGYGTGSLVSGGFVL